MLGEVKWWTAGMWFPVRCQTDEQFTSKFSVTRWTFFIRSESWCDERCTWEFSVPDEAFFIKTVWLLTKQDVMTSAIAAETFSSSDNHLSNRQPDQWRDDESSSFVLLKFSTSKLQLKFCLLCRDWQHLCVNCDILYNIVNCAFTVLLYCYCNAIVTSVCPSISEEHYQILSICRELGFFFNHKNTYPLDIFHLSIILLKLLLPITNCLLLPT